MFVIVGLGNPDKEYDNTYHNMGFMAIDKFAQDNGFIFTKSKYNAKVAEGLCEGEKVILIKPQTYMNLSGKSVGEVVKTLKLPLSNLLVVYDDIDMPVGAVRFRLNGSAGTHNGMRNIVSILNSTEFPRIRIGIGRDERMDLASYVLSKVNKENMSVLQDSFEIVSKTITKFIKNKGKLESQTIKG